MLKIHVLVLASFLFTSRTQATKILLDSHDTVTNQSQSLTCSSESPWFFCVWEGPLGGRLCSVQSRDGQVSNSDACGDGDGRFQLLGNSTHCTLVIDNVGIADNGEWTCALTDHNMDTTKQYSNLDIVKPGTITMVTAIDILSGDTGIKQEQIGHVEMIHGDTVQLQCQLEEIWPLTNISWSFSQDGKVLENLENVVDIKYGEQVVTSDCEHCSLNIQQTASLTLYQENNGLVVKCNNIIQDVMGRDIIKEAGVHVEIKAPLSVDSGHLKDMSKKIGLLPGIVISVILILLSIAILISFCIRGSQKRKQSMSSSASEDPEIGQGLVDGGIIKNKDEVKDLIENVYDDVNKDNSFTDNSIDSSDNSDNNTSDSSSSDSNSAKIQTS